jgi:hypothetical protein
VAGARPAKNLRPDALKTKDCCDSPGNHVDGLDKIISFGYKYKVTASQFF